MNNKDEKKFPDKKKSIFLRQPRVIDKAKCAVNDPRWYGPAEVVKDIASIPFNIMTGAQFRMTQGLSLGDGALQHSQTTIPGVAIVDYEPSLGCPLDETSAANVGAKYLFNVVRKRNSGAANYESPDLYMMIIGWLGAKLGLDEACRVAGLLGEYSAYNRYLPNTLVDSLGFNYEAFSRNAADFRSKINELRRSLNSIKIPKGMPVAQRWQLLGLSVFSDEKSDKTQFYAFKAKRLPVFSGYTRETGTELVMTDVPYFNSVDQWYTFMHNIINTIITDSDISLMSGDILKAYESSVVELNLISDNYVTEITFSEEILYSLKNGFVYGDLDLTTADGILNAHQIYQEDGIIKERAGVTSPTALSATDLAKINGLSALYALEGTNNVLLTKYDGLTMDADEVMTCTRFSASPAKMDTWESPVPETAAYPYIRLYNTGTEILTNISIIPFPKGYANPSGFVYSALTQCKSVVSFSDRAQQNATGFLSMVAMFTQFDWLPIMYVANSYNDDRANILTFFGEVDAIATPSIAKIGDINRIAVLYEIATNELAKF